jgi:aspartoacylase
MQKKINNVAIVGGTHGNELAGIYLINYWQKHSQLINRANFTTELLLANHNAITDNRRYTDCDLNRQFSKSDLLNFDLTNYEQSRAKVINQQLGPKGNPRVGLVIDLHNTTSNMGPTLLIPGKGDFYDLLAIYVKQHMPEAVIFLDEEDKSNDEHHLLATIGTFGVIVEVGPVPQGVLKHEVTNQMQTMTQLILDFVEHYNNESLPPLLNEIEAFRYSHSITLPVNLNNQRIGMVHKEVEGSDFKALEPNAPLFALFDGSIITFDSPKTMYPAFINEAAYYDNNLAMSLCDKVVISKP